MPGGTIAGFFIRVNADGTVTVENSASATGGSGSLTFNTVSLSVDPGAFTGRWRIERILPERTGPLTADEITSPSSSPIGNGDTRVKLDFPGTGGGTTTVNPGATLTLDNNRITSKGAQKLAKAILT